MATKSGQSEPLNPLVSLSKEARERLEAMGEDLTKSDALLDDLEGLGMDVTRLKENIAWGKKAREVILKHLK